MPMSERRLAYDVSWPSCSRDALAWVAVALSGYVSDPAKLIPGGSKLPSTRATVRPLRKGPITMKSTAFLSTIALGIVFCVSAAEAGRARTILDEGQCPPYLDKETGFWGFDCLYYADGDRTSEPRKIKISPQFSWASPFINDRARVLLGCRLASCRHEPRGRRYDKRLYVFIDAEYDFVPASPYDQQIWNPNHYAIYNEDFRHVGSFNQDYPGLACVAHRSHVSYIDAAGNIVFKELEKGMIAVPATPAFRTFLQDNRVSYSLKEKLLLLKSSPVVIDFLLREYDPPTTPVTAKYHSVSESQPEAENR